MANLSLSDFFQNAKKGISNGFSFLFSRYFLFVLFKIVLIVGGILGGAYWFLGVYTKHGESVTVSNVIEMNMNQAKDVLSNNGLELFVSDSMYAEGKPYGTIISQEPSAGSKVKTDRLIYCVVASFGRPTRKLNPKYLICQGVKQVRTQLRNSRFIIENEVPEEGDAVGSVTKIVYNGRVLFDCDKGGSYTDKDIALLPEGSKLTIHFIAGTGEEIPMPNLVGKTLSEAYFELSANGVNVGDVLASQGVMGDSMSYFIWKQSPEFYPNGKMRKGEAMDIFIQKEKPEPELLQEQPSFTPPGREVPPPIVPDN